MRSWQNVMKNYDGQLQGFKRIDAADKKQAEETAVLAWLKKQGPQARPRWPRTSR